MAVDGRDTIVDALRVGDYGLSLIFPDEDHAIGDVQLAPGAARGELLAQLSGRTVRLSSMAVVTGAPPPTWPSVAGRTKGLGADARAGRPRARRRRRSRSRLASRWSSSKR